MQKEKSMDCQPENQFLFKQNGVEVWIKRLDTLTKDSRGNKLFKLHFNLNRAKELGQNTLLTFGGAYSSHISAVAATGKEKGFRTIGVIRGDELGKDLDKTLSHNPTLAEAYANGMKFYFVSREAYRNKASKDFLAKLHGKFGDFYLLPEGGTNELAVKGCEYILDAADKEFDIITCPVGTGGTISGIINASGASQKILGFSALKANLEKEVEKFTIKTNWKLFPETKFGGFAKINSELVGFMNKFAEDYRIVLNPIYTGKMMFSLIDMIKQGYFKENSRILAVHTGGLQGIQGINAGLNKKQLPILKCKIDEA